MKLSKLLAGVVLSVFVTSLVVASTNEVTSVNAVGYIKINVEANKLKMIGTQFIDMNTNSPTVKDVLGTNGIPSGTKVYVYNSGYSSESFSFGNWVPGTNVIDRTMGFWIKCGTTTNFVLKGEVPAVNKAVLVKSGLQMISYPFPVGTYFTNTVVGKNAGAGDKAYFYETNGTYSSYSFSFGSWVPSTLYLNPGDAIWYKSGASTNKILSETVPYSL